MAVVDEEEQAVRARLRSKEAIFERAVKKFLAFTKQTDPAEALRAYHSLIGELEKYELDTSKTQLVFSSNLQEVASYHQMSDQKSKETEQARLTIEQLKKELEQARIHRKHLEEYDQLAKMINTFATRQSTEIEIAEITKDIEALEREAEAVNAKIEMRGKQYQLLMYALHELHAELYDEDEEEKERAAKRLREEEEAKARAEAAQAEVVVLEGGERDLDEREDRNEATRSESRPVAAVAATTTMDEKEEDGEVEEGAVEPMDASGV